MTDANGIRQILDQVYRTHVAPGDTYALVDFPDHANVGDSAIWLGEIAMLRAVTGRDPAYVSTWHDFDAEAFRRACPAGTLFLHGGGNLGDIWPHHQHFREQILADVRDRPVVQLPQSIHFRHPDNAARFATLAAAHPDFTLYVRDRPSVAFANSHLACSAHLASDSAFALGPQTRMPADCDVLMLLRTDDERRDHVAMPSASAVVVDWLDDEPGLPAFHEAQAKARVDRGLRLLSTGRVIVTDRLHGHILADLLGIPHVVLDNDYGKIAAYLAAWPGSERVPAIRATTMEEAERAAAQLA
ncbi:polysaccharide pyruvyl transferase family protein [uncultured Sphingomonas sp.]|uniref:polysaccharide pyruvyl transferase family protein n=1 Tax=uncultured Sphingomonas sp. TaxID=158754 RepID=UPI00262F6C5B|nr:polysaccharide pyruvyl transferase family protein [uncultured Sphingomonas sp.]